MKKSKHWFLILSSILSLSVGIVAVSCNSEVTKTNTNQSKNSNKIDTGSKDDKSKINDELAQIKELNSVAQKVTFTVPNAKDILSSSVNKELLKFNNIDEKKYKIDVSKVQEDSDKQSVIVLFEVQKIGGNIKSDPGVFVIKGFKKIEPSPISKPITPVKRQPILKSELDKIAQNLKFDYNLKDSILAKDANVNDVTKPAVLPNPNVDIIISSISPQGFSSAKIYYFVIDKLYPSSISGRFSYVVNGFKSSLLSKDELNKMLKKVVLTIENPESKTVYEVNDSDYVLLGVDPSKFAIVVNKKEIVSRTSIKITYALKQIGGTIESNEVTKEFDNLKFSLKIGKPFERPANVFERSQPIANPAYDVSIGSSQSVFNFKDDGAHSYRIPSVLKLSNGDLIISADKRLVSAADHTDGAIEQVIKISKDNGSTWSKSEPILKISAPRMKNGLVIDGVLNEVWIDKNNHTKGKKLLFMADTFTGFNGLGDLKKGVPFIKVGNESLWRAWVKNNAGDFLKTRYVFRKVPNHYGWWRLYSLPEGLKDLQITEKNISSLVATKTYLNMNYDPVNRSVSGQIYANVEPSDFDSPSLLNTKSTIYSIFDNNKNKDSKFSVAVTNYNLMIESFDNGKTWTNSKITDAYWRFDPNGPEFIGSAVGDGIQLQHQKDPKLNGRIIFPLYTYSPAGVEYSLYIYSDDNGDTWHKMEFPSLPRQNSESKIFEMNNGDIYWFFRNHTKGKYTSGPRISKSTDGGLTWHSPVTGETTSTHEIVSDTLDGDVFAGVTHFNIKGQNYFLFAAPDNKKVKTRTKGGIFITKDWKTFQKVWTFDTLNTIQAKHFGYSYPLTVDVGENYADIILAYEQNIKVSNLVKPIVKGRETGVAITVDKFRVLIK